MEKKPKQKRAPAKDDVGEAAESGEPGVAGRQQGRPIDSKGEPLGRKDRSPEIDLESGRHGTK